jgi:hypothetical protein
MEEEMKNWFRALTNLLPLLFLGCLIVTPAVGAPIPIDLSTWSEQGPPANGNWVVSAGGDSVTQTINGNPTFFVSPDNYLNTEFKGKFKVVTGGDDDYIGFVFGYTKPIAGIDGVNDDDFLLFAWKQVNQAFGGYTAYEGFTLSRVQGTIAEGDYTRYFWGQTDDPPLYDVLASDYGSTRGWADNTEYEFTLLYQTNHIKIDIKGGTGDFKDGATIFDVTGIFPDGRFGFYNYSQSSVTYQGFTEAVIPIPGAIWLLGSGLVGLAGLRRYRKG